jgi:hypothetical protein
MEDEVKGRSSEEAKSTQQFLSGICRQVSMAAAREAAIEQRR